VALLPVAHNLYDLPIFSGPIPTQELVKPPSVSMMRTLPNWMCFVVVALVAAPASAADVLVVCPAAFQTALAPWERYRKSQGHELLEIEPPATSAELRTVIRQAAERNQLRYVVLVGDVRHPSGDSRTLVTDQHDAVPTCYVKAQVNVRWGSEPTIATDQLYADVDGDRIPDLAIGRIPAHSPAELSAVLRKILRYEQAADEGTWHRRVNIVAGVGGFGTLTDALVEAAGRSVVQQTVPASYDVVPLFASPTNPASPPPDQFRTHVRRQIDEGSLVWVYLGHGLPTELDSIRTTSGDRPILAAADVPQLHCGSNSPLAVLIACYTGAIDAPRGCLAESLLLHEQGPVAVVAATRVTMPYGNAVFGCELLRSCFGDQPATLGDLWKLAQRRTLAESPDDPLRKSLDALAGGLSPPPVDLVAERREHVQMYQLFGDPLLRLQYPRDLQLTTTSEATSGEKLVIEGRSNVAGQCTVELVPDPVPTGNASVTTAATQSVEPGPFRVTLQVPTVAAGKYTVRGFVAGQSEFAMGATTVALRPPNAPMAARASNGGVAR
jgi:hypothetical protein